MKIELPWKTWLVALALVGAAVFLWNREHRLRSDAQQDAEDARLTLRGVEVEEQKSRGALEHDKKDLIDQNELLREAYEKAVSAAPDAKVVSASRLDTGPVVVPHVARPHNHEVDRGTGVNGSGTKEQTVVGQGGPNTTSDTPIETCALREGDMVHIQVDVLELQTKMANTIVIGTAGIYVLGTPATLLLESPFKATLSTSAQLAAPKPPRWGVLALGACGSQGCGPGIGALLPPFTVPLVHWQAEALLGAVAAPGGLFALGGVGARW